MYNYDVVRIHKILIYCRKQFSSTCHLFESLHSMKRIIKLSIDDIFRKKKKAFLKVRRDDLNISNAHYVNPYLICWDSFLFYFRTQTCSCIYVKTFILSCLFTICNTYSRKKAYLSSEKVPIHNLGLITSMFQG